MFPSCPSPVQCTFFPASSSLGLWIALQSTLLVEMDLKKIDEWTSSGKTTDRKNIFLGHGGEKIAKTQQICWNSYHGVFRTTRKHSQVFQKNWMRVREN